MTLTVGSVLAILALVFSIVALVMGWPLLPCAVILLAISRLVA
jgi:hypothetical protein